MFLSRFKTLLLVGVLLFCGTMTAGWWKTYGGLRGNCIQIESDSNYIISGVYDNGNLWLLKTDTAGNILWSKTCGTTGGDYTRWLEETSDGGFIVAAWTPSLAKTDAQGDTLWTRDFGIKTYCVQEASDEGYIVIGGDNGYEYDGSLILTKTNAQGNVVWTRTHAEPGHNVNTGLFIQVADDNGYIITGLTGIESEEFSTRYLWLVKTDADGNIQWSKQFGSGEMGELNTGHCVRQTSDQGYIITGSWNSGSGIWVIRTDDQGDTLWTKVYSTPHGGRGLTIQLTPDNGYILTAATVPLSLLSMPQYSDFWLFKIDSQGDSLWARFYGKDGSDICTCIQSTSDSGYIVVGSSTSWINGEIGLILLKTDSLGLLGISEKPCIQPDGDWNVVNPIGPHIILRYTDMPNGLDASVFDASGCKVDDLKSPSSSGNIAWGNNHPSGVYFIKVNHNQTGTTRVVLIH